MDDPKPGQAMFHDPVWATMWMLERLPLNVAADFLALIAKQADEQGLLSPADKQRLITLLDLIRVIDSRINRVA